MNEEKMVPDSELAAIVRDVQPEEGFEFHRVQEGYPDGVPRAVFIGPDDEPIGIQMSREAEPLRFLVGRLAADLATARDAAHEMYQAAETLCDAVGNLDDFSIDDPEGAQLEPALEACQAAVDLYKAGAGLSGELSAGRARRALSEKWEKLRTASTAMVEAYENSDVDGLEEFERFFVDLDEALADIATEEERVASGGDL